MEELEKKIVAELEPCAKDKDEEIEELKKKLEKKEQEARRMWSMQISRM